MGNKPPEILRRAIESGQFVVAPGVYDALGARLAEQQGFPAVYMSGLAVTASLLGRPDLELLGMAEMVEQAGRIVSAVGIPVIADADTGYGGLSNIERTVQAYCQAGVAAIHLEDQASPKRCGHMAGVRLIETAEMQDKLRVAMDARGGQAMLLIGRTDAAKVAGLDEAIRRARLYAETGVDLIFVDGLLRSADFRRVREEVPGRLLASIVEINAPALTRAEELQALGYSIAIYALSGVLAAAGALQRVWATLQQSGATDAVFGAMLSYDQLNQTVGLQRYNELWNRYHSNRGKDETHEDR